MIAGKVKAWLLLPVMALAAGGAMAQQPASPVVIALGGDGLHFSTLHVADGEGLFAKEGIKVDWVDVGNGPKSLAAVLGGSADLSPVGTSDLIKAVAKGLPVVAVSTSFDIYPTTLVLGNAAIARTGITPAMSTDEKVKRIAGANLTIGITTPGSATDDFIRSLLKTRGYDADKVANLQPVGSGPALYAAFEKGTVDGFVWFSPFTDLAVVNKQGQQVVNPFNNDVPEMVGMPYTVLITSRATLAAKHALLAKAILAYTMALKAMADDPATARQVLKAHFSSMNQAALDAGITTYFKGTPKTPVVTPEAIARNAAWMSLTAAAPVKADYGKLVDTSLAVPAYAQVFGK